MDMKPLFVAALALTGTASVALADGPVAPTGPVVLTEVEMDEVTAGQNNLQQFAAAIITGGSGGGNVALAVNLGAVFGGGGDDDDDDFPPGQDD